MSPAMFIARMFLGSPAKDEIYVLDIEYKFASGMAGTMEFAVDSRDKADAMISRIMAAVQGFHGQVMQAVHVQKPRRPTPTWP